MEYLEQIGARAKTASFRLSLLSQQEKKEGLLAAAEELKRSEYVILEENEKDRKAAAAGGMTEAFLDRLSLDTERIAEMSEGLNQVAELKDPIGDLISMENRPNGLQILKKRVPLGVVGIIYESRPNVTADAFGLCFKTGNAVILRGGSDAICSNIAIVSAIRRALANIGLPEDCVQLLEDTSRETATEFMRLNQYLNVLIPRGGAGLIQTVVKNSTVPVIETGIGNCHIYVDEMVDFTMALDIIDNAKTQRLSVCNTCESLVIHQKISKDFLPLLEERLSKKKIIFRADAEARSICKQMEAATEEDFGKEYLDRLISVKTVSSLDEAITHINQYNTGHSDAIITKDYANAMRFLNEIDSAAVYVNASTRFTDGGEFGFGAEIGISTQKLHARGPMGLEALTTSKYVIFGNGQIRP